mgnify:CR=1 FL=1
MGKTNIQRIEENESASEIELPENIIEYDLTTIIINNRTPRIMSPHFVTKNDAKRFEKRVTIDVED